MPAAPALGGEHESEKTYPPPPAGGTDAAVQSRSGTAAAPTALTNFLGVGRGFTGPDGTFTVGSAPPDTDGDVGPDHYVQIVNSAIAVFTKTGTPVLGPIQTNTIWGGFGGMCQTHNDGDGIVKYDRQADRWIVTQFAVSASENLQCVAVSTTPDPTGSYNRYSFAYSLFPDYPKLSVWPDAYYITFNMFAGNISRGAKVCAYDRQRMFAGQAASQQCFDTGSAFHSLLASDLDGATPPPAGSANYLFNTGTNSLNRWMFHVDWATPGNSTMTGPTSVPVAAFSAACGGGACVTQKGTKQKLDSLGDRLMWRLAYRNFGDHESLVATHSVAVAGIASTRWYEIRNPGGTPSVFQQGTFNPDSLHRWMGSIAMDGSGNIALGYSTSSANTFPAIRYTGHLVTDPPGMMGQGEAILFAGTGSQTQGLGRWGDYSAMAVDPTDDCTFWYTNEYLTQNGSFNWSTRIGSFKFAECGAPPQPDFSLSASPTTQTVAPGGSTSYTTTITPSNGFSGAVALSVDGLPAGASGTFSPNPATTTSTLNVVTSLSTPAGSYPLTITGTAGSLTHTAPTTLVVSGGGGGGDFTISASPANQRALRGQSTTYTITITPTGGFVGSVTLSASGGQPGSTYSFSPNPATSSSVLTVQTLAGGGTGTFTITIQGTSGSVGHSTTVTITTK